ECPEDDARRLHDASLLGLLSRPDPGLPLQRRRHGPVTIPTQARALETKREATALAGLARDLDLAAEQPRVLLRDREAEAGARTAARRVGLVEALERCGRCSGEVPDPPSATSANAPTSALSSSAGRRDWSGIRSRCSPSSDASPTRAVTGVRSSWATSAVKRRSRACAAESAAIFASSAEAIWLKA